MCGDGKESFRPVRSEKELREDARKLWKEKYEKVVDAPGFAK